MLRFLIGVLFDLSLSLQGTIWTDCSRGFEPTEVVAQTVTVPSPAEIDYKAGLGKEFREALGGRTDIDWKAVQDHYREWSEHTTTLSGPARMLVACVLSVVTQGMGTSQWLAGHGIAEGTATNAALSSGIQTLAASAGTALAANLGDLSKAFDELTSAAALKNFASTMLTAGISQSVSTSLQLPDEPKTFTDSLKTNATHGLVRTGVDSAINGGKVGKNLAQTMTSAAVDASSAQLAHGIGNAKATGALNQVTHKAAHGALAVTGAKLTGRDPLAGAIGAVVAETVAESKAQSAGNRALEKTMQAACSADHKLSKAEFDALLKENLDTEMHRCVLTGQLAGASAAFLADRDVVSAQSAAQNATENNFALTTAVAVGAGAVLVAANVYDYYQAYIEGGWNAVQAKWDEERALDTSLATAGAGAGGIPLGPVGSAVGAAGGAIVGNATLRTKSILQRLMKNSAKKVEEKLPQLMYTGKKADHHIFPQQFKKYFSDRGINIDNYTISIDQQTTHLKAVHGSGNLGEKPGHWNQQWAKWIKNNPSASQKEIYQQAGEMLQLFNLQDYNIHPYKK